MRNKIANTNAGCAICPCIGCNHKLFGAVGHFSFVLWLLKDGAAEDLVSLENRSPVKHRFAVGGVVCQRWNSLFLAVSVFFCLVLFYFSDLNPYLQLEL